MDLHKALCMFLCAFAATNIPKLARTTGSARFIQCSNMTYVGRCDEVRNSTEECSCDNRCHQYGDCCLDFFSTCYDHSEGNPSLLALLGVLAIKAELGWTDQWPIFTNQIFSSDLNYSCMEPIPGAAKSPRLLSISACPTKWKNYGSDFCEHPDPNNVTHLLPIYDKRSKLVFKNVYCAECHGLKASSKNLVKFIMGMECTKPMEKYEKLDISDIRSFKLCSYTIDAPFTLRNQDRRCSTAPETIDTCSGKTKSSLFHPLCRTFRHPVQTDTRRKYKSPFCAACNDISVEFLKCAQNSYWTQAMNFAHTAIAISSLEGINLPGAKVFYSKQDNPFRYSFQMLFDFRNDYSVSLEQAGTKEIELYSPFVNLRDALTNEDIQRNNSVETEGYTVIISTNVLANLSLILENFAYISGNISVVTTEYLNSTCGGNLSRKCVLAFGLYVTFDDLANATENLFQRNGSFQVQFASIQRSVNDDSLNESGCEYEEISIKRGLQTLPGKDVPGKEWNGYHKGSLTWNLRKCDPGDVMRISRRCIWRLRPGCVLKTLDTEMYDIDNNPALIGNLGINLTVRQNETYYTIICADETQFLPSLADSRLSLISIILMSLSLVSLVFTFVTYIIFRKLRTVPGICVMHLLFSLIIVHANYLLLISKQIPDPVEWLCMGLAMLKHVMWLATFFWQSALAVNLAWSLNHLCKPTHDTRQLQVFTIVCWGAPLVLVGVFATLDHFVILVVGYGLDSMCWIRKYKKTLLGFVFLPMVVSLVVDIVCFVVSFRAIYKMNRLARGLGIIKTKKGQLLVCIKIFILLGATWIFVVVADAVNEQVFWTLETVVNASQGVFFSGALMVNETVYNSYKDLLLACVKRRYGRTARSGNVS